MTASLVPISYTPFANDYARYVSPKAWSDRQIALFAGLGMFIGCWIALVWAAYMSTMMDPTLLFMDGLVAESPSWYVVCLMAIGFFGSLAQGAICLYGTGLDTSSLIRGWSACRRRWRSAPGHPPLLRCAGRNPFDTVSAFLLILIVIFTPWMVIYLMGLTITPIKRYHVADLQLFDLRQDRRRILVLARLQRPRVRGVRPGGRRRAAVHQHDALGRSVGRRL